MGVKEAPRHRERRVIYAALRDGTLAPRRPLSPSEVADLFNAIDHRISKRFGVRALAAIDLDSLHAMPASHTRLGTNNVGFERRLTLLSYAAWRRRHDIVKQLLIGGATPTLSDRAPAGALSAGEEKELSERLSRRTGSGLESAAATYAVECVARLRCFAARDVVLGAAPLPPCAKCGVTGRTVCFDACGCSVCEGCVWRTLLTTPRRRDEDEMAMVIRGHQRSSEVIRGHQRSSDGNGEDESDRQTDRETEEEVGVEGDEIVCPRCGAHPPMRGAEDPSDAIELAARGLDQGGAPRPLADWTCECCAYANFGSRPVCRGCAAPRVVDETLRPPPPSLCREGLPAALVAWGLENSKSLTAGATAGKVWSAAADDDQSKAPEEVCSGEVDGWRSGESSNAPPIDADEPRTSSNASPVEAHVDACMSVRQPRCGAETDEIDEILTLSSASGGVGPKAPCWAPSMRRVLIEMVVDRRRALGKQLTFLMSETALL